MRGWIHAAIGALALTAMATPSEAEACSCLPPSVSASYQSASGVWRATIIWEVEAGDQRFYVAGVADTLKGCPPKTGAIVFVTHVSSATCGAYFEVGTEYLVNGFATDDPNVFSVHSCSYNRPWSTLTTSDKDFLSTRYNCCGDSCACTDGSEPVACLVDPCEVAPACPDAECESNYCGGCHAEHYDHYGQPVCQGCATSADCGFGQFCNPDGVCRVACYGDFDCPDGTWCRTVGPYLGPADDLASPPYLGPAQCVPFADEGDVCGGFVPPWMLELCGKGLSCDTPESCPPIADAPGICRPPCESNADCDPSQYCASDGLCHDDGTCDNNVDCNMAGNNYIHPACVGYGVCNDGMCGWRCGTPQCVDVGCVDFGPCRLVLGWGVVDGRCELISGCTTYGLTFFDSADKCRKACRGGGTTLWPRSSFSAQSPRPR